ncbi:PEP-CTERM sorting domain-containing protein [Phragmitibacter flavus]|uniref:PEP-CTERM sorting domain-containing protein n=1 Tax=Phragmitibacter flavus TaxID=2576071 RepID=A0A5R8KHC9_9BACT|nr:autotransporter-associated beta strand repeat-containing protein [Phragmitibacter flavus]TLD71723.1 PEP-CTERM sorting domain-containing protein [Phragmitibacter flavus]
MSRHLSNSQARSLGGALLLLILLHLAPNIHAQTATWNGLGPTDNWSESTNWTGTPPTASSSLAYTFGGTTRLTPFNDLASLTANGITFSAGAGAFTLSGTAITLAGNITNSSSNLQTIDLNLAFSDATQRTVNSGSTTANLTISGDISGTGGIIKTGAGTLTLSGNNTFDGNLNINAGILRATSNTAFGSTIGTTTVANGTRIDLDTTAGDLTITGETLSLTGNGGDNNGALRASGGNTATWTGAVSISSGNGANRLGAIGNNSTLNISGTITGTGDLAIRTDGNSGKVILSGTNNSWGNTYAVVGTVQLSGGNNRLPATTVLEIGNGTNVAFAAVDLNGTSQTLGGLRTAGTTMGQTLTNTDLVNLSTLTLNNNTDYTFGSNAASGTGLINGNLEFIKTGTGTFTMQGTSSNTYTGQTLINGGTLVLNKATAGTLAINGPITIGDGTGQDILRLGQSQQIADTSLITLNGTGPNAGIFQLNSFAETIGGLDGTGIIENNNVGTGTLTLRFTVPAVPDITQTYAGILRDGDGIGDDGTLALTLAKTGAGSGLGTLVLTNTNTYSGQTNVGANTVLRITNADALGTGGTTANGTIVADTGRVELTGGITVASETITINGSGGNPSSMGALRSIGGGNQINTWAGNIILGSGNGGGTNGTRVGATNSTTLLLLGQISDLGNNFDLGIRSEGLSGIVAIGGSATNTWRNTFIVVGTTRLEDNHDRLPTNTIVTLGNSSNAAATELNLNGYHQTIAGLSDAGTGTSMSNVVTNRDTTTASTLTLNNSTDQTYGATSNNSLITGNLALIKTGTARQTLGSANTYTGATTVNNGILEVGTGGTASARDNGRTGNNLATNLLTVIDSGLLIGTGTIAGTATTTHLVGPGGTIAPGDYLSSASADPTSIGTLDINGNLNAIGGAINLQIGGTLITDNTLAALTPGTLDYQNHITANITTWENSTNGTTRGEHDLLNISGQLSLSGDSLVTVSLFGDGYSPQAGDIFDVLDWTNTLGGSGFNVGTNLRSGGTGGGDLLLANLNGGLLWDVSQFSTHGILIVVVVPEPTRALLLTLSLSALLSRRRR